MRSSAAGPQAVVAGPQVVVAPFVVGSQALVAPVAAAWARHSAEAERSDSSAEGAVDSTADQGIAAQNTVEADSTGAAAIEADRLVVPDIVVVALGIRSNSVGLPVQELGVSSC